MATVKLRLSDGERRRLERIAARLQMDPKDTAERLLRAAIDALEHEERIQWPIFLRTD